MDVIGELISIKIPSKSILSVKYYCQIYFNKKEDRHLIINVHQLKDSDKKDIHMFEHIIKWKEDIVHSCKLSIIEAASCSRLLTGTHALYMTEYNPQIFLFILLFNVLFIQSLFRFYIPFSKFYCYFYCYSWQFMGVITFLHTTYYAAQ